jgi:hypothetical protein
MSKPIILLENEPLSTVLCKWAAWMAIMIIFTMFIIYYSNYFARERFIDEQYNTWNMIQDLKNLKWKQRFEQTDKLTYI